MVSLKTIDGTTQSPDAVHVWWGRPNDLLTPHGRDRRDACLALLDDTERARFALRRHDADLFLASHAALRLVLSHHIATTPPDAWRFTEGPHGRPELDFGGLPLRFNLSHTEGLFAIAIRWHTTVGVDVERLRPMPRRMAIARRFFDPEETRALEALAPDHPRREFFTR